MKILRAKIHPDSLKQFKVYLFIIDELITIPPKDWLDKRMDQFDYKTSFKNYGMKYPICVSTGEHDWVEERFKRKNLPHVVDGKVKPGLYVQTGNKRVLWAKENGYTHIEGYLVDNKQDKSLIRVQTHIQHNRIPK